MLARVEDGVVGEVGGRVRLVGGDDLDEPLAAHRLERIVVEPLDADRGDGVGAQVLPAERPGAMRGVDERFVRKWRELPVHRVVEHAAELLRAPAQRRAKIGAPDVADEQRVAGQHRPRIGLLPWIVNEDRDRLRRVARGLQHLEAPCAELD